MNEFKKTGFLFPGQGAQFAGMGKEICRESDAARRVFQRASQVLGYDMLSVCTEGPEETLTRTDICQPAILTVSIAVLKVLNQAAGEGFSASAYAGLSLGEYSALVASGAIELEKAVELTAARGRFMQEACEVNPGTMCSVIGLEAREVEKICLGLRESENQVWPANYNSESQIVISGEHAAVSEAARLCRENGARMAVNLDVAGPFHTPLMQTAALRLEDILEDVDFQRPSGPVIANVTGQPLADPDEIREMLARQVTHPVKWYHSVERCRDEGIEDFLEIGPGKVLSGLIRRIDRSLECIPVLSPQDVSNAAAMLKG